MSLDALLEDPSLLVAEPQALWSAIHTALAAGANWEPPPGLADQARRDALRREAVRLIETPAPVVLSHLDRVLLSPAPGRGLDLLQRTGVLAVLLPEVEALVGFHRSTESHHKDLFAHTRTVIAQMPFDADLRWAALMHDVGKIATRVVARPGGVTFWRHEALGAWLMRGVSARLAFPAPRADRICFVIAHHGRVNAYEAAWSDRAVRRLASEMGPGLTDLIAFSAADVTTRRRSQRRLIRRQIDHLERRLERLAREATAPRLPSGFGRRVSARTGVEGRALGELMEWMRLELVSGRVEGSEEALLEHLSARPEGDQ